MDSLLVKNGLVVLENETFTGDVLIEGGVITRIGSGIEAGGADNVIDASGKFVFPGAVDVHTHFALNTGLATASDDFYTGTVAAACGGTTTIVDHIGFGPKGCALSHQIDHYHRLADGKAVIDYGFHGVIQHVDDSVLREMETLAGEGITSWKLYMTYGFKIADRDILRVMARVKEMGLMLAVHPENDGVIAYFKDLFLERGLLSPVWHAKSRPARCEADAVNRLVLFSEMLGDAPLYIVHLSNALALEYCEAGRARGLKRLLAETCPQYLLLNDEMYERPDALKYIMSPPLRGKPDNDALWRGVAGGSVHTVATDHCPFPYATDKQMGKDDFTQCPNGAPGVETRVLLMFSEGVSKGRISAARFAEVCAANPAKLFGLYPKKGVIAEGSDGDLVIIDPERKGVIRTENLHENVDYTPYEGFAVTGAIDRVISRGEVVVQDNAFVGKSGRGRFIRRGKPIMI